MVSCSFIYQTGAPWSNLNHENFDSVVGYAIANGVATWCWIFIQLSVLGTAFFLLSTLGMSIHDKRGLWPTGVKLLIAMTFIGLTMIGGGIQKIDAKVFDTSTVSSESNSGMVWVLVFIGAVLLLMQLGVLILVVAPVSFLRHFEKVKALVTPSLYRKEGFSKRAAGFKTEKMLDNALEMHQDNALLAKSMKASTAAMRAQGNAMTNFQENSHVTEYVGGVWWAWKNFFNSSMLKQGE